MRESRFRLRAVAGAIFAVSTLVASLSWVQAATPLNTHAVVVDDSGKIIPWNSGGPDAYDGVVRNSWNYLLTSVPMETNGLPSYYSYSYLNPDTQQSVGWPHDPAGLYSMLTESAIKWYRYSGDMAPLGLAQDLLDYQLAHGMTAGSDNWPGVSYASADPGATTYQGASYGNETGIGDGTGVIEPDKVGEQGFAFLQMFEQTGNTVYRDAAINAANALATHVRAGDATHSPWPFRVDAATGAIKDDYSAHTVSAIQLFDELTRLGLGDITGYQAARTIAWNWTFDYPYRNGKWDGYFEDIPNDPTLSNPNQLNPMMFARYLLEHPELDPGWEIHVRSLIAYVENNFSVTEHGANTIREQGAFMHPMGSHTSRYASVNALLYERTGDAAAKEKAYRAFNWATYMDRANGVNIDGPEVNNQWFTDGYGDYIRHFMTGMGAVPEWAPNAQNHLLDSTSTVTRIAYAAGQVDYATFDDAGTETLKLAFVPSAVTLDRVALGQTAGGDGWNFDAASSVLTVRHSTGKGILVTGDGHVGNQPPTVSLTEPANGTVYQAGSTVTLAATAADSDGRVTHVDFVANGNDLATTTTAPYSYSWTNMPAGNYTLTVRATDNGGASATSVPVAITVNAVGPPFVDSSAPTVPGTPVAGAVTPTSIALGWTESTDDIGVTGYRIYRDGTQVTSTTATSFTDTGLAPNTSFSYTVTASDAAGNESAPSSALVVSTSADTTPPTTPTNLAAGTTPTSVSLTWASGSDDLGVTGYQIWRNGEPIAVSQVANYTDDTATTGTTYSYYVVAYDAAANVSAPSNTVSVVPAAATLVVDKHVSTHQASAANTIVSPSFTTTSDHELLVAFIASDGPTATQSIRSVTGGGLTWTLAKRTNTQRGTSEIWTARSTKILTNATVNARRNVGSYQGTITIVTFIGASQIRGATAGASGSTGAPSATVTTTRDGSWVWAVGNDWDRAAARTVGPGQTRVDEYLLPAADTCWVQRMTNPTPTSGTVVTVNDTAPTNDRWNLAAIEILPAP